MPLLGNSYARPQLADTNIHPGGRARLGNFTDPGNPNRYAADWTLLRHVTLLVPRADPVELRPSQTGFARLTMPAHGIEPNAYSWLDSEIQVGGQPAASSVFRALAVQFPTNFSPTIANQFGTVVNPAAYALRGTVRP